MKIKNESNWQTNDLRKLITEVCRRELLDTDFRKRLVVEVEDQKLGGWCLGKGSYYQKWIKLFIPKGNTVDSVQLAKVIAHELAHTQGVRHKSLSKTRRYGWVKGWREEWAWAGQYVVRSKETKRAPKPTREDRAAKKLENAQSRLEQWERKVRLARNRERKWRGKVKYYQGRIAAIHMEHD